MKRTLCTVKGKVYYAPGDITYEELLKNNAKRKFNVSRMKYVRNVRINKLMFHRLPYINIRHLDEETTFLNKMRMKINLRLYEESITKNMTYNEYSLATTATT